MHRDSLELRAKVYDQLWAVRLLKKASEKRLDQNRTRQLRMSRHSKAWVWYQGGKLQLHSWDLKSHPTNGPMISTLIIPNSRTVCEFKLPFGLNGKRRVEGRPFFSVERATLAAGCLEHEERP